jgi:hypothetical protein
MGCPVFAKEASAWQSNFLGVRRVGGLMKFLLGFSLAIQMSVSGVGGCDFFDFFHNFGGWKAVKSIG